MRPTRWLLVLVVLAVSCRGDERPRLPLELEWKRATYSPVLLDASSGGVVVGEGSYFRLYAPDDDFLVAPRFEVSLAGAGRPVVSLSATRAIFSQPDPAWQEPTTAIVVDLTSGMPPVTWSVKLSPGSTPLVSDGHWLLASYPDRTGHPWLELVDLDQPSTRFTHRSPDGSPGFAPAIAAQGHMLVFLAGYFQSNPGTHQWGWVRVSPELASAGQWYEEEAHPDLTDVFEAVVEGDEVLLANVVYGPTDAIPPRIRIARHGLSDGRPQLPPSKATELELPLFAPGYSARFAWDGRGTGVVTGLEQLNPCRDVTAYCLATATPAYLVEEGTDGFHARPLLLPYLELDDEASYPLGWTRTRTLAVRDGRLLALQGPPYALTWYRIDGSRAPTLCEGDVKIESAPALDAFLRRGCTALHGRLEISGNDLERVDLPDLALVGHLVLAANARMRSASFPALEAVAGDQRECFRCGPLGLLVGGNPSLERLELPVLTSVADGLTVVDNPALPACEALAPLASLRNARASVSIHGNGTSWACPELRRCQGDLVIESAETWVALVESGCTEIAGGLTIGAAGVARLPGDPALEIVHGQLTLRDNATLERLSLPALTKVDAVEVVRNVALAELALPELVSTTGLWVRENAALAVLALPALREAWYLEFRTNPSLGSLDLPALTKPVQLQVEGNSVLASFSAPRFARAGALSVTGNPLLERLGLPLLSAVDQELTIDDDTSLVEIDLPLFDGLGYRSSFSRNASLARLSLPSVATFGTLSVDDNPLLGSLALPALTHGGALAVNRNASLASLMLPSLTTMSWDGRLEVTYNPVLTELSLPVLSSAGAIFVYYNDALASLSAPALVESSGGLYVFGMALVELKLPALTAAGQIGVGATTRLVALEAPVLRSLDYLYLTENAALERVNLGSLTSVEGNLQIVDNPLLPQCWAEALLEQLRPPPPPNVTIQGNDTTATCPP